MFLTPYQTTACSPYDTKSIRAALQRSFVHGDLKIAKTLKDASVKGVYVLPPYVKDIPPFTMPLDVETPEGVLIALDTRGVTKAIGDGEQFKIVAPSEYEGAVLRGALTRAWIAGGANDMRRWNDIAARVFLRLLTETLVRRLNLSPAEQQAVYVTTGLFYYSNFADYSDVTRDGYLVGSERELVVVGTSRLTKISPQTVSDLLGTQVPVIKGLDGFCDALRQIVKSPRLEKVDAAFVITLMGGYWYGGNARLVMAVALEYPPVWFALMYQALNDRSYHGSQLAKMANVEDRQNAGTKFSRDVLSYLELLGDE